MSVLDVYVCNLLHNHGPELTEQIVPCIKWKNMLIICLVLDLNSRILNVTYHLFSTSYSTGVYLWGFEPRVFLSVFDINLTWSCLNNHGNLKHECEMAPSVHVCF